MSRSHRSSRYLLALLFIVAGILHFVSPQFYLRIMPPWLPAPQLLVQLSGAAELLGGLGLLLPATRRLAGWGLLLLLLAVFPANIYTVQQYPASWLAWARLPLQPLLMWWVWRASCRKPKPVSGE